MEPDLDSGAVQKYLLDHPKFLDDFVKLFVALERVRNWVKAKTSSGNLETTTDLNNPKGGRLLRSRVKGRSIPACSDSDSLISDDKIRRGNPLKRKEDDEAAVPLTSPDALGRPSIPDSHNNSIMEESENLLNLGTSGGLHTRVKQSGKFTNRKEKFCCTYCNKYFEKSKNLKEHMRIHTKECPYRCRQCGKEFRWRSGYRRHVLGEHPEMWEERMSMTLSQKRAFFTTSNLRKQCSRTSLRFPSASRHVTTETEAEPTEIDSFKDVSGESTLTDETELCCDICTLYFDTSAQQQNHFRDHEKEGPFQCSQCSEHFSNPRGFSDHLGSHKRAPIFSCSVCQITFLSTEDLSEHLKVHPVNLPYQCKFCDQEFRWKGAFFSHIKTKHKDDVTRNSLSFYNSRAQEQASVTVVVNSEVNEKDLDDSSSQQHQPVVSIEKLTSRGDFETVYTVAVDELEHGSNTEDATEYCCDICSKLFQDLSDLVLHLQVHNIEKPFKCQLCSMSFSFTAELTQHLRSCKEAKLHKCRICHSKFSGKSNLKEHYRIHTNEFPYRCKFCSKLFRWRGGLYSHVEKCHYDLCKGRKISALEMRNTSHSVKLLPDECHLREVTSKGISRLGNGHLGTNSSDNDEDTGHSPALETKPYRCAICDSTFSGKSHLKEHQRIHTMENPYRCKFCQKEFRWRSGLYTHVRRMHKEETNGTKISASDMRNSSVPVGLVTFELLSHIDQSQVSDDSAAGTADITCEVDDAEKHSLITSQGGLTDNLSSSAPGNSVLVASDDSFRINNIAESNQGEGSSYRTGASVDALIALQEPSAEASDPQRTCEISPGTLVYFQIPGNLDPNGNSDKPSDGDARTIMAVPIHHEEVVDINT